MSTTTANLSLTKPTKTTDVTWWSMLNSDFDIIDALFVDSSRPTGNVVYYNSSGQFAHDASNFFWDATNKGLALGGSSVTASMKLDVRGNAMVRAAAPQMNWYDTSGGADAKWWSTYAFSNTLVHQTVNDAGTVTVQWLQVIRSGTSISAINFTSGGVTIGNPTGGSKGTGTLNCTAAYDDNVLLTDHIVDLYFDGRVREEDQERYGHINLLSIGETQLFMERYRHLPSMPGREEWRVSEKKSLGEMVTYLWETVERQMLHTLELNKRIERLEKV